MAEIADSRLMRESSVYATLCACVWSMAYVQLLLICSCAICHRAKTADDMDYDLIKECKHLMSHLMFAHCKDTQITLYVTFNVTFYLAFF